MTSEMYWAIVTTALQALLRHWEPTRHELPLWLTKTTLRHALEDHTPFVDPEIQAAQQGLRQAAAHVTRLLEDTP
jgi:hypothetical protein